MRLRCAQVGAALFFLGVVVANPQAIGIAAADSAVTGTSPTATDTADTADGAGAKSRTAGIRGGPAAQPETRRAHAGDDRPNAARRSAVLAVRPAAADRRTRSSTVTATATAVRQPVGAAASGNSRVAPEVPAVPTPTVATGAVQSAAAHIDPAVLVQTVHSVFATATNWLSGLPANPATEFLQGALLMIRRTLFNAAPAAKPLRAGGAANEPIAGSLEAIDPEGDSLTYTVTDGPEHGTVTVDRNGNYSYTPDPDFTGIDTFAVSVVDTGWHVNLLEPFLPPPADTVVTVAVGPVPPAYSIGEPWDGYAPPEGCACQQTWSFNSLVFTNGRCGNPDNDVNGPWCRLQSSPDGRTWSYCSPKSA